MRRAEIFAGAILAAALAGCLDFKAGDPCARFSGEPVPPECVDAGGAGSTAGSSGTSGSGSIGASTASSASSGSSGSAGGSTGAATSGSTGETTGSSSGSTGGSSGSASGSSGGSSGTSGAAAPVPVSLTSTTLLLTTLVPGPGGEIAGLGHDPANVDAIVRIAADGTTLQIAPDACGAYGARTLTFAPDDAGLPSYGILAGNGGAGIGLCWRDAADVAADAGHDTQSSVSTFQVLDAVPLSIDRQGALVAAASSNPDRMSFDRTGLTGLTAVPACAQLGTRAVPRQIGGGRYSAVFLMSGTVDGGAVSCLTMPDGGFVNFGSAQVSGYDLGALAVEPSDGGVFVGGTYGGKTYLAVNPAPFSIANALAAAQPGRVVSVAANAGEVAYVSVLGADGLEYLSAWYPDGGGPTVPIEGFLPEPGGGLMGRPLVIANDGQVWLTTDAGLFRWTP